MSETLFKPKGDVPEWQMIYDLIRHKSVGELVDYSDLSEALGRDFEGDRNPFYTANSKLLETANRGLINVRGQGYRVISAEEHEDPAKAKHLSARRQLRRARTWIEHADRNQMSAESARRFDSIETSLRRQEDMARRLDDRVQKVELAIEESRQEITSKQSDTDETLAKLVSALKRAGIEV